MTLARLTAFIPLPYSTRLYLVKKCCVCYSEAEELALLTVLAQNTPWLALAG
jgi:hypothetical protein